MLINYLKIALRNIKRHSLRSFIHVIGLSIGIAACFVIYNLVAYEYGFDTFHTEKEKINRITTVTGNGEENYPNPGTPIPLAEAVRNEMKSAEAVTQIYTSYRWLVESADKKDNFGLTNKAVFTDPEYFDFFEYEWLAGSPATLKEAHTVVLTQSTAQKYFGDTSPNSVIGKELIYTDTIRATVTGIVADLKEQTDLIFTDFLSYATILNNQHIRKSRNVDSWNTVNSSSQIFVKIDSKKTAMAKEELLAITDKYIEKEGNWTTNFNLEPFSELHFEGNFSNYSADKSKLNGLIAIAFFILVIACINFINLETAQSKLRAKEVAVRKTLGSSRKQLVWQFLTETYLLIFTAIILSIFISELSIIYFKEVLPEGFNYSYFSVENLLFLLGLSLIVLLLSGFYPASVLSGFSPIKALRSTQSSGRRFNFQYFLRKNLIVFQFASSIAFIIVVLGISAQINYLMKKDVGFNKEAVVHINTPFKDTLSKTEILKSKLESISGVKTVSLSSDILISSSLWTTSVDYEVNGQKEEINIQSKIGDTSYLGLYEVPLLAGRNYTTDETEIVVNEATLERLGILNHEEALGKSVIYDSLNLNIVGVIPDIHTQSMYAAIRPMMMGYDKRNLFTVNVKLASMVDITQTMEEMKSTYQQVYPNETYEFQFLDETVESFYKSEVRLRKVLFFATAIAILISCLGLFGLASFTIAQRTKEISIRKVLGASISSILVLISKEYALLIGISFIVAIYPAWFFMSEWLNGFQFKMNTPVSIYLLSGLIAFILSIGIVALHSLKAANSNPAEVLKDE
ncbi:ABC transporter permease [Marivirga sp. S37H4]|uniref:ABC transporter permease n=1 Tax=Marivirga aurantiaca TaxID=2802615 RepID=A0A935CA36_9BACT|nr:ABC transporter permease [Marivirga aurantiaca]MBK6266365.1 ABC transporter permease [Marivirga aurantiaca]